MKLTWYGKSSENQIPGLKAEVANQQKVDGMESPGVVHKYHLAGAWRLGADT